MNKQCFQVIFSKSQQQFIVVSELAKLVGKSSTAPKVKVDDLFSLLFENLVGKENSQSETWQNNQLQAGKLVTNSANGKLLLDATNVKANRWEGEVQEAEVISRQDITKYNSEQVQGGVSGAIALGSGVGGSINLAYNSAKLNTAQVENQTRVDIGKGGMNVTVKGNTHLDGAIITSEADKENNRFQTGTLTTSDIQNHSELKTRSVAISGGTSGINPLSALSLLGNKNDSEQSTTKAAIGENINIVLTNDENAERTLNNLNRDTQNANQKVTKHDINQVQETQELIKGIGEISDKAFQIYTHSEREAIEKAKLELGKVETRLKNEGKTKEEIAQHPEYQRLTLDLSDKQQAYDKKFGTGSDIKRGVDALTVALQGLSAKDVGQAAVGLASPYLNEQIKKHTAGNTEANLIAHALLGAVEAVATGNNALAGAAAGAGSEAAADFIVKTLYKGKSTQDLTEAEKQNVALLSQLASGLASGLIGDSTQSAAVGADIGKRAVENNLFNQVFSQPNVDWATVAEGQLKEKEALNLVYEQYSEIMEAIEAGKTVGEILIDFTPVLGDAKAFYEAEGAIDYALAMAGVFPIAGDAIVALKGAKSAYKAARKAELSGDVAEAQRNLQEGKKLINQYYTQINDLGDVSTNNKVKTQLKTELAFKEADILNVDGTLTRNAIADSSIIPLSDGVIRNPEIVKVLTRDGSKIEDWNKYTTQSIKLPSGQSVQIHYYKNEKTGKVDYETKDFKVKGVVKSW